MRKRRPKRGLEAVTSAALAQVRGGISILLPARERPSAAEHQTIELTYQKITEPWK